MTANTGAIVAAQIKRADTRDIYPIVDVNDALGGLKSAANAAALPALLNLYPMDLAIDQANGVIYQYVAGAYIPLPASSLPNLTPSGSSGTVTSVSVVTANGVSGSVANPTTTPAITLTLGAITPTSVAATGTVTGSNLSGTNTGNVTLGTANGLSLSGQALSLALASTSTTGSLSSTDWNTFNGKGSGSVTSVAMTVPSFLSVSGSPITGSGTLAVTLSGTALPIANGGTGQTAAAAAFNALSPLTTLGDTLYGDASGAGTRLAGNTTAAKQYLSQTGTGAVSAAPVWATIANTDITGLGTMSTQNANAVAITGGKAIFNVSNIPASLSSALGVGLNGTSPYLFWVNGSGATDSKIWDMNASPTQFTVRILTDVVGTPVNVWQVTRSAALLTTQAFGGRILLGGATDDGATILNVIGAVKTGALNTAASTTANSGTIPLSGINATVAISAAGAPAITNVTFGMTNTGVLANPNTGTMVNVNAVAYQNGTGAVFSMSALSATIQCTNTGTVSQATGLSINKFITNGSYGTIWGINIAALNTASFATNTYGIFQAGASDKNFYAGRSIFGTNTDDGVTLLQVRGAGLFTGLLTLATGTATAGTEPVKFTAGVLNTVAVSGAMETDAANLLYYTPGSAVRLPFFPMTTVGDIIIGGTVTSSIAAPTRLAQGGNGTFLGVSGGVLGYYTPAGGGNVSNSGTPTVGQLGIWVTATTIQGVTTLPTAAVPAFTGDMTNSAGSLATTVGRINGTSLAGLATGILKNTTTTGVPSIAAANTDYLPATTAAIQSAAGAASAPALSLTGTPFVGTGTTSTPQLYLNGGTAPTTWNSTASGGTYLGVNAITGFAGNFLDFRINGGSTLLQADSSGELIVTAFQQFISVNGVTVGNSGANGFAISSTVFGSGTADTFQTRAGAANWRYGQADTAAPVAQSISMQGVVAGTTNTSGANTTFNASQGTGTGTSGSFLFKTAAAGSTGTSQNALSTQLTIGPSSVTVAGTLSASNLSGTNTGDQTFASLSPLTTKGDVLGFSTVNSRVPVGVDTFVLTADSTQTLGVKWAAAASGGGVPIPSISGNWYASGTINGAMGVSPTLNKSTGTGLLFFSPFFVTKSTTYTHIGTLTGATTSGTVVMGIYNDSGSMAPTGSPITNSNSTSIALSASTFASYTFSSAITLSPGIYWLALSVSATNNIASPVSGNTYVRGMGINATPTSANILTCAAGYSQTFTYSATLPAVGTLTVITAYSAGDVYTFLQAQ